MCVCMHDQCMNVCIYTRQEEERKRRVCVRQDNRGRGSMTVKQEKEKCVFTKRETKTQVKTHQ